MPRPSELLQQGDRGPRVETLQQSLVALGYSLGTTGRNRDGIDGDFRGATQDAVVAFQRDRGMPAAQQTGVYGPITRAEMAEAVREGWRPTGAPQVDRPATDPPAAPAPRAAAPAPAAPSTLPPAGQRFADTPGPYAAVSTGALLGTQTGTPLGALTAAQSYALGRAVAGDGPGAAALEAVDRQLGTGSGVFVQRVLAMGQHEGGLDFGRRNPDPGQGPTDQTAGYDSGTFQIGGRGSTPASTAANVERYLTRGIQVYRGLAPGAQVDRATLNVADRDILAHIGYMAARGTEAFRTPLPENEILRRMANPTIQGDALVRVVRNDVQGGDPEIGQAVVQMTSRTEGTRVDLAAVNARTGEPDALRREPSMPVFNQASALKNSERGPVYSPAVEAWQQVLVARGLDVGRGGPDGVYGAATRTATEQLQRAAGLPARGNVGPQTWAAYGTTGARQVDGGTQTPQPATPRPTTPQPATPQSATPQPTTPTTTPPSAPGRTSPATPAENGHAEGTRALREGATGAEVVLLQQQLKGLGYALGTTGQNRDGVDGQFGPRTHGAVEAFQRDSGLPVDGVVGRDTRGALPVAVRPDGPTHTTPALAPAGPGGDGAATAGLPRPIASLPGTTAPGTSAPGTSAPGVTAPPKKTAPADPRMTIASAAFLREVDQAVANVLDRHVSDVPGALAALVRDTRGPGSGVLGATTGEDVQRSFARFTAGDAAARPLSATEAGMVARVIDERARIVAEGGVPTPQGDGASTTLTPPSPLLQMPLTPAQAASSQFMTMPLTPAQAASTQFAPMPLTPDQAASTQLTPTRQSASMGPER